MNIIYQTLQREYGFYSSNNFDLAIKYAKCFSKDNFHNDSEELRESPMIACRFCRSPNYENYLALANEDGVIIIQDTHHHLSSSRTQTKACKKVQGHQNVIFDLAWSPASLHLVSVSGDHTAALWDVGAKGESMIPIHRFHGHVQSVKTVSFRPEEKCVFATGSRDGKIMIWDYRLEHSNILDLVPDNIISYCHFPYSNFKSSISKRTNVKRPDSITSVLFKDSFSIISCSAGDRSIKVWDIRKCYSVYKRVPQPCFEMMQPEDSTKNGFSNLVMDSTGVRLYANCMDDVIYCYNVAAYLEQPVAMYKGHTNWTYYVKSCLSHDDRYLVSGSSDKRAYIWNVNKSEKPMAKLVGHGAEVTSVDWCSNGEIKLVTCSDDFTYRIWTPRPDAESENVEKPIDLQGWAEPLFAMKTDHKVTLFHTTPKALKRTVSMQEHTPDTDLEDSSKKLKDDSRPVLSTYPVNSLLRSDSKGARRLFDVDSTCDNPNSGIEILSPTSNLPNYIIDGTSPHHRCTVNRQKENQNWLKKLQVTPPPKNSRVTPKRKSSQTTPKTPKLQCGSLLKFFRGAMKQTLTKSCEIQREPILTETITTETSTS